MLSRPCCKLSFRALPIEAFQTSLHCASTIRSRLHKSPQGYRRYMVENDAAATEVNDKSCWVSRSGENLVSRSRWLDREWKDVAFVRLIPTADHELELFRRSWTVGFAGLNQELNKKISKMSSPRDDTYSTKLASQLGREGPVPKRFQDLVGAWETTHLHQFKHQAWPILVLHALHTYPDHALHFFDTTWMDSQQPQYVISDCLEYLTRYHLQLRSADHANVEVLFTSVIRVLRTTSLHLSQRTIWLLSKHLNESQLVEFYELLIAIDKSLSANTLLQLIDRLGRFSKSELAVDGLKRLSSMGADFTQPKIESVCATIFRGKYRQPDTSLSDSQLFSIMLDAGLEANTVFYNIWIQNLINSGDPDSAWNVYNKMIETRVWTDEYTISILLNDAKLRLDYPGIMRILHTIRKRNIRNRYIANDLLHAIFLIYFRGSRDVLQDWPRALERMINLYREFFDTRSISELLPVYGGYKSTLEPDDLNQSEKMPPSLETLSIMIIGLLRGSQDINLVMEFYNNFHSMVLQRQPLALALALSGRMYDTILMALGSNPQALNFCTEIVSEMLKHGSGDFAAGRQSIDAPAMLALSENQISESTALSKSKKGPRGFQPSVRTWSILLYAFAYHKQVNAAEKVLEMMRSRDVQPNQVTWNTLAMGYARQQNVRGAIGAIERLEAEGWEIDDWTMRALMLIRDKNGLMRALEEKERKRVAEGFINDEQEVLLRQKVQEALDLEEIQGSAFKIVRRI